MYAPDEGITMDELTAEIKERAKKNLNRGFASTIRRKQRAERMASKSGDSKVKDAEPSTTSK